MVALQIQLLGDYAAYLATHPEEAGELINALLINVTEFFRDPEAFNYLKDEILPTIIQQHREQDRTLRLWCAGCASGEEPYSLAMLLLDLLEKEVVQWSIKIFATDVDEAAIAFARHGLYPAPLLDKMPETYRERFFESAEGSYRVTRRVRQLVTFGRHDLSRSGPFPHIDLVVCRNVLIYFSPDLQTLVLNNFAFALQPQGYLFLGKAEAIRPRQSSYEVVNKNWKIYQCTGTPVHLPRRLELPSLVKTEKLLPVLSQHEIVGGGVTQTLQTELSQLRNMNELLLRFLPMGILVIDRTYRLVTANLAVRRLLGLHETGEGMDFLHAVRGIPYEPVRSAIDQAFREKTLVSLPELELNPAVGGTGQYISFSIVIMQTQLLSEELAAISITDITEYVQTRQKLEAAQTEQIRLLENLQVANQQLRAKNIELLEASERMQVSNEELLLAQEELQASVEEYETTNEELQATNEELETSNEETQAMNEELQATNDEFRARTQELQELAAALEREQQQLQELSRQLLTVQERERQQLARELHDQIGQELTAVHMLLDSYQSDQVKTALTRAAEVVRNLIKKVRELALDLRPSMLDDLGLLSALGWHLQRYTEQTQVQVDFKHQGLDRRFAPELETAAFRIVQEALTNIARHAKVQAARVDMWDDTDGLWIRVEDTGVGFDPRSASQSFGLAGMRERARLLGAELNIKSAPGQGTLISVKLPIPQQARADTSDTPTASE